MVHAVSADAVGTDSWQLELRCPNCELRVIVFVDHAGLDRLEARHDRGTEALAGLLVEVARVNREDMVARFVAALEVGPSPPGVPARSRPQA